MKLRSNKVITPKCHYCVRDNRTTQYYPNPKWSSCSRCFEERQPEKWLEFLATQWCPSNIIPPYALQSFLDEKCITQKTVIKMISLFLKNFDIDNAVKLLKYHQKNNDKWGISAKQAGIMYSEFKTRHGNKHGNSGTSGAESDWKIQHLFAGFILDKWNIKPSIHGPVAYCYYGNFGDKPRGTIKKLSPCVALQIGSLSGSHKPVSDLFKFWLKSVIDIKKH
tara:strand:- start:2944 stop:3609 length:666 start_codon:yes stop_codon:yes gene_type:complete